MGGTEFSPWVSQGLDLVSLHYGLPHCSLTVGLREILWFTFRTSHDPDFMPRLRPARGGPAPIETSPRAALNGWGYLLAHSFSVTSAILRNTLSIVRWRSLCMCLVSLPVSQQERDNCFTLGVYCLERFPQSKELVADPRLYRFRIR